MADPMVGAERLEVARVRENLADAFLGIKEYRGDTFILVRHDRILEVLTLLKDDPDLDYGYFSECLGVDYSTWQHPRDFPEPKRFEVVYNLMSLKHMSRIFVKVTVDDGDVIPTAKRVYLGAEYPEREIADLYGLVFTGNELVGERFLLPDDWIGFPLRKEYPLGGDDVIFDKGDRGPAVEDLMKPHAGSSFEGKTGSDEVAGR